MLFNLTDNLTENILLVDELPSKFSQIMNSNVFSGIIGTIWMLQFLFGTIGKRIKRFQKQLIKFFVLKEME